MQQVSHLLDGIVLMTQVFVDDRLFSKLHTASLVYMWQGEFACDRMRLQISAYTVAALCTACITAACNQQLVLICSCCMALRLRSSQKLPSHMLSASSMCCLQNFKLKADKRAEQQQMAHDRRQTYQQKVY